MEQEHTPAVVKSGPRAVEQGQVRSRSSAAEPRLVDQNEAALLA